MCVIHHRHYPIETNQSISGPSTLLKLRVIETLFLRACRWHNAQCCKPTHAPTTGGSGSLTLSEESQPVHIMRSVTAECSKIAIPTQSAARWTYATCERVQRHGTFLFGRDATRDLHSPMHLDLSLLQLEQIKEISRKRVERKKSARWGSHGFFCQRRTCKSE